MIDEILRLPAPGPEPLGLAFDGTTLWIASREAHRLYAVNPATWIVGDEAKAPGAPFGIAVIGDELSVVIGLGDDDDDRYIYRFDPARGFKNDRITCPDLSGAHVAFDGDNLYLSQAHNRKILALDAHGVVTREILLERRPVGTMILDDVFYLVTCDVEWKNHELTTVDARGESPRVTSLASIPFGARGLTFDGTRFWTSDRRANEIVAFAMPAPKSD
jgi:hypothetical protein